MKEIPLNSEKRYQELLKKFSKYPEGSPDYCPECSKVIKHTHPAERKTDISGNLITGP
jgi:hypothetical protein